MSNPTLRSCTNIVRWNIFVCQAKYRHNQVAANMELWHGIHQFFQLSHTCRENPRRATTNSTTGTFAKFRCSMADRMWVSVWSNERPFEMGLFFRKSLIWIWTWNTGGTRGKESSLLRLLLGLRHTELIYKTIIRLREWWGKTSNRSEERSSEQARFV